MTDHKALKRLAVRLRRRVIHHRIAWYHDVSPTSGGLRYEISLRPTVDPGLKKVIEFIKGSSEKTRKQVSKRRGAQITQAGNSELGQTSKSFETSDCDEIGLSSN